MKKINLTIPKPCHENWDQMTPEDKGRFCGSCQKTVIDFTDKSDRELAAFFKKPVGSVCGRFHQGQLNREITVPKKRIPFLRYFFHIAWPAFIVMLKSCGPKDRVVVGDIAPAISLSNGDTKEFETMPVAMGAPFSMPEDSLEQQTLAVKVEASEEFCVVNEIMGDVAIAPIDTAEGIGICEYVLLNDSVVKTPIDTAILTGMPANNYAESYIDTSISIAPFTMDSNEGLTLVADKKESEVHSVIAYPNPSHPGSILNLKFAEKEATPVSIQLLTSGGQRVLHKMLGKSEFTMPITLKLPNNLTSGVYFIQVIYASGGTDKVSVMVRQ